MKLFVPTKFNDKVDQSIHTGRFQKEEVYTYKRKDGNHEATDQHTQYCYYPEGEIGILLGLGRHRYIESENRSLVSVDKEGWHLLHNKGTLTKGMGAEEKIDTNHRAPFYEFTDRGFDWLMNEFNIEAGLTTDE